MSEIVSALTLIFTAPMHPNCKVNNCKHVTFYHPRNPLTFYIGHTYVSAELLLLNLEQRMATSQRISSKTRD